MITTNVPLSENSLVIPIMEFRNSSTLPNDIMTPTAKTDPGMAYPIEENLIKPLMNLFLLTLCPYPRNIPMMVAVIAERNDKIKLLDIVLKNSKLLPKS